MASDDFHPFRTSYETRDGRAITLRAVTLDDADAVHDVMSQPRATWGTMQMPMTLPSRRYRMLERNQDVDNVWAIGAELDGRIVGNASLVMAAAVRRRHTAGIGMSVHDTFQGLGVGTALLGGLIELSDEWLNLHRLELTVYTDNVAGIALYRKYGFATEGTYRNYAWRGGRYVDALAMARLRD